MYLAKEEAADDGKPDPKAVSAHAVRVFHDVRLPQFQQMAAGKIKEDDLGNAIQRWAFDTRVYEAKRAVEAIPNGTDDEIRTFLKTENDETGITTDVSADLISLFKSTTLPEDRKLASGETKFEPM